MRALKSIEETARLLGISKWTVRGYIRDGKLRPVRLGRRVLLAEDELERFVESAKATLGNAEQADDSDITALPGGDHAQDTS